MPVPIVRYNEGSLPLLAPNKLPSAAALTFRVHHHLMSNFRRRSQPFMCFRQPGLGVDDVPNGFRIRIQIKRAEATNADGFYLFFFVYGEISS